MAGCNGPAKYADFGPFGRGTALADTGRGLWGTTL